MVICGSEDRRRGDHVAIAVQVERTGAGVGDLAVGRAHLEEPFALDYQVQGFWVCAKLPWVKMISLEEGRAPSDLQAVGTTVC